ncbi:hypothetical protein LPJ72_002103 [Coemansia sp. Benny D160-2]|nr:hypothetical protein LPJ72_002103 [Coemansia sp. Benny D160-2]
MFQKLQCQLNENKTGLCTVAKKDGYAHIPRNSTDYIGAERKRVPNRQCVSKISVDSMFDQFHESPND